MTKGNGKQLYADVAVIKEKLLNHIDRIEDFIVNDYRPLKCDVQRHNKLFWGVWGGFGALMFLFGLAIKLWGHF